LYTYRYCTCIAQIHIPTFEIITLWTGARI
jgi:hypothetical protein